MYSLLFTTAFLLLMALFSSSEMGRYQESALEKKLYESHLAAHQSASDAKCASLFEKKGHEGQEEKPKKAKKAKEPGDPTPTNERKREYARSLKFSLERPPNNGKLNLYPLLYEEGEAKESERYEITAQVMRRLYGNAFFFQKRPRLEYEVLDALIAVKERCREFSYPDELAALEFEDKEIEAIFLQMMRGGTLQHSYPSLLEYITFDKQGTREDKKINFLFASEELLRVIFKDGPILTTLLPARDRLWEEIMKQEGHRKDISPQNAMKRSDVREKVHLIVTESLRHHGVTAKEYVGVFDYTLGKKGTIYYVKDPITRSTMRQKV